MKESKPYFEFEDGVLDEKEKKFVDQLNDILQKSEVDKEIFDLVTDYALAGKDVNAEEYVDSVEVDGKTYLCSYEFDIQGITYTQFVNEENPVDILFMRHIWDDDEEEEYFEQLDSDLERDLVYAFEQKFIFEGVKKKLENELKELEEKLKKGAG